MFHTRARSASGIFSSSIHLRAARSTTVMRPSAYDISVGELAVDESHCHQVLRSPVFTLRKPGTSTVRLPSTRDCSGSVLISLTGIVIAFRTLLSPLGSQRFEDQKAGVLTAGRWQ